MAQRRRGHLHALLQRVWENLPEKLGGEFLHPDWLRKHALIINLPGQPKAIRETLDGVFAAVPYCIDLIGGPYIETHEAVVKAFRPKSAQRKPA